MGSDPRRLDGLRADERAAARLLERVTGGTVRAHDVGTRQGAYDLHLTFPGGRTAAVEVTSHTSVPDDVADLLTVPHVARRVAKVTSARGVDERHLFVTIGVDRMPDAVRLALADPSTPPEVGSRREMETEVPPGLTRLWLTTTGPGAQLVSWARTAGWRAHPT
jgi:endonuclease III